MNYNNSLNQEHVLGPARDVNIARLRDHLILEHGVSVEKVRTKGELGKLHLLVHAVLAYPELRELMNIPPEWGKG